MGRWEPTRRAKDWHAEPGDGVKTIEAQYKGSTPGRRSRWRHDPLDTVGPVTVAQYVTLPGRIVSICFRRSTRPAASRPRGFASTAASGGWGTSRPLVAVARAERPQHWRAHGGVLLDRRSRQRRGRRAARASRWSSGQRRNGARRAPAVARPNVLARAARTAPVAPVRPWAPSAIDLVDEQAAGRGRTAAVRGSFLRSAMSAAFCARLRRPRRAAPRRPPPACRRDSVYAGVPSATASRPITPLAPRTKSAAAIRLTPSTGPSGSARRRAPVPGNGAAAHRSAAAGRASGCGAWRARGRRPRARGPARSPAPGGASAGAGSARCAASACRSRRRARRAGADHADDTALGRPRGRRARRGRAWKSCR